MILSKTLVSKYTVFLTMKPIKACWTQFISEITVKVLMPNPAIAAVNQGTCTESQISSA